MMRTFVRWAGLVGSLALATGCGDSDQPFELSQVATQSPGAVSSSYRLATEPPGARGVIELRKEAHDGDEVVIIGRIAGSAQPLVKGRAAFTIVDLSLEPCDCDEPWVYCCTPKEDLKAGMVLVKFVDAQGQTVPQDARQLLGVKEWDMVVVHGHAKRDQDGNLTAILADGLYARP